MADSKYGGWDLLSLKKELKLRGARLSGRKKELIERLEAYDRNKDFGNEKLENEYYMTTPSLENYKDVNSGTKFIKVKLQAVESFLEPLNKQINDDVIHIYKNRFLKYIRIAHSDDFQVFFRSECRAEMKKSVSYNIDLSIDKDGCVTESQCECAAGMGPTAHCKHICVLLYALYRFSETFELIVEETCTQKLQTFHKSKQYYGSPIKAQNQPLAQSNLNVNFEPRPDKYINRLGYPDYFRSNWVSHPAINQYPISQSFSPANPVALDVDHDYLQKQLSEKWLEDMKISNITQFEIDNIEKNTRGQSSNPDWFRIRNYRLHSSNFGKICKATERTDLSNLAQSLVKPSQSIFAPAVVHGRKYESTAIKLYESLTGNKPYQCGIFVSSKYPFLASSPDALLGNDTVIEVKCPYSVRDQLASSETVPYIKLNEKSTLELSQTHDYYFQVQGQMLCTARNECQLIVYTFKGIEIITIERNQDFINDMVVKLSDYYCKYFKRAILDHFFYKDYKKYSF